MAEQLCCVGNDARIEMAVGYSTREAILQSTCIEAQDSETGPYFGKGTPNGLESVQYGIFLNRLRLYLYHVRGWVIFYMAMGLVQ